MLGTTGSQDTTEENGAVVDAPPFGQHAIYPTCHHCLRHSRTYHHVYHWKIMAMILMLELTTMLLSALKVHKNLMKKKFLKLVKTLRHQTVVDKSEQGGQVVDIPPAKLAKLKVSELKQELAKRGQPVNGLKAVLLERLKAALQQRLPLLSQADQAACATDDLKGFSPTARWRPLQPIAHMVKERQNVVPLCAPTVPEEDAAFGETFDCAPFVGMAKFQNSTAMAVLLLWMENNNGKRRCQ